jgi:hypothetical protein
MVNQAVYQAPKAEIETFLIQGKKLTVEFTCEKPYNSLSEVEIESVNGIDPDFIQDWVLYGLREKIRLHKCEGTYNEREIKEMERGMELYYENQEG